jgi:hypothetical protein
MKIRFVGFPPHVDVASIEKGVNREDDVLAAAERVAVYYNGFYHRPHVAHRCDHEIGYRVTEA